MALASNRTLIRWGIVLVCFFLTLRPSLALAQQQSWQQQEQQREEQQREEQQREEQQREEQQREEQQREEQQREEQQREEQQREEQQQQEQQRQQQLEQQRQQQLQEQQRQQQQEQQRQQQLQEQQRQQQLEQQRQQQLLEQQRQQELEQQRQQQHTPRQTPQPAPNRVQPVRANDGEQKVLNNPAPRQTTITPAPHSSPAAGSQTSSTICLLHTGCPPIQPVPLPAASQNLLTVVDATNPGLTRATAQYTYAQQQMVQSQAFQQMIALQIAQNQMLSNATSQMAAIVMNSTSDPNVAAAMQQLIGQDDPIQDALNQQLQNLSDTSAILAQNRLAAAQSRLVAQRTMVAGSNAGPISGANAANVTSGQTEAATDVQTQTATSAQGKTAIQAQANSSSTTTGNDGERNENTAGNGQIPQSAAGQNNASNGNSAFGQYIQPIALSCVRTFNDPSMYGWFALQNTCSQTMTVSFVGKSGNGAVWGSMDLAAGQSQSTGESPAEINAVGGIFYYPCPYGFIPTDVAGNSIVGKPVTEFVCKYRGY